MNDPLSDLETFKVDKDNNIIELEKILNLMVKLKDNF